MLSEQPLLFLPLLPVFLPQEGGPPHDQHTPGTYLTTQECKHVLAVRLCEAMGGVRELDVTNQEITNMLKQLE
ncbi:hypothetical protein MAR_010312 [Mya arenaria]|uniref:Uncharacterized protein n=1 Tax=Mya arenaria TaxID=6604 RepID=A0ABY7E5R3_MYAAR|nr:hypothetical protein MAR_010312 [Mya arenaria]